MLCVTVGLCSIALAWWRKIPISFAWSTPGAAFLVCGVLILLCGLWPALGRAITSIPKPIASAMLAGILFPICIAPVTASFEYPLLALPIVGSWFVFYRLAPRWVVPAAMLAAIMASPEASPPTLITAIVTFLVTTSEISIIGIGSAFWGLLVGAIFMLWLGWGCQRFSHSTQSERDPGGATS